MLKWNLQNFFKEKKKINVYSLVTNCVCARARVHEHCSFTKQFGQLFHLVYGHSKIRLSLSLMKL